MEVVWENNPRFVYGNIHTHSRTSYILIYGTVVPVLSNKILQNKTMKHFLADFNN